MLFFFYWADIPTSFFFFFQAEDGIRDLYVTGVQTCALPIWNQALPSPPRGDRGPRPGSRAARLGPDRRRADGQRLDSQLLRGLPRQLAADRPGAGDEPGRRGRLRARPVAA